MEVIVGKLAGFCPGVENTVKKAKEYLKSEKIYCLGEIIHNEQVIKSLEDMGMMTVNSIDEVPNNSKVIFRAHGEAKCIYDRANEKQLEIIDLTCGKVKAIHYKVERELNNDSFIIIVGKKKHPEVIGTKGFAGKNSFVIESEDDILDAYMEYEKTNLGRVYVVAQTTFSSKYFDELIEQIKTNFIEADVIVDKTICDATEIRQSETLKLSKEVNKMIVIGGKNSSNTKELAKIAEKNCKKILLIQSVDELVNEDFGINDKIGIVAGASTPKELIEEVKQYLNELT